MTENTAIQQLNETIVPFTTADGFELNLVHIEGPEKPTKGPVLLVHGAGVRAHIFRPPLKQTLVDMLVVEGYDVWLENWRASIDMSPSPWNLDLAALNDHPAAVQKVVEETGVEKIKAIIHCQGSTSFMMSLVSGLLPQVSVVISNAVSLHTVLPKMSGIKLNLLATLAGSQYPYLNPQWGLKAPTWRAKIVKGFVALTHHECSNMVCKVSSFTYGIGFPTLWEHSNLDDITHDWIENEFAWVPTTFFSQMNRSAKNGSLVPISGDSRLPASFVDQEPKTDARVSFFAGELNRCFLMESQKKTYEFFDRTQPGRHSLHIIPKYAHLDIFIGKNSARDVFPLMLEELAKPD